VEFFLPQLAHMAIHLELNWSTSAIEQYVLMLSQTSFHAALQFTYIIYAAMEDCQPEDSNGVKNPNSNPSLFLRCARLLRNIERAIIYESPTLYNFDSSNPEDILLAKTIEADDSFKVNLASTIINQSLHGTSAKAALSGMLMYKRTVRKLLHFKRWKPRWFKIEQKVLLCYQDERYSSLCRAINLPGSKITENISSKHAFSFEVESPESKITFKLLAANENEQKLWVEALRRQVQVTL